MTSDAPTYDAVFYEYQREGALRSARRVTPLLREAISIRSVLDVGCGAGAWLRAHQETGVDDVLGIDGDYVDRSLLVIEPQRFAATDITAPFDLGRTYDLVQCLEVAEHVPAASGPALIDNLVRHGRFILFSAAVPGQGGKGHINERPLDYWRGLFAARGFRAFDFIRPRIVDDRDVEWWYRFNTLFYAHESVASELSKSVLRTELARGRRAPDVSPLPMRLRKMALRALPNAAVSQLAVIKHRQFVRSLNRS